MDFFILALATFRISSLVAEEDGPFGVFEGFRKTVGVRRDEKGENYGTNNFSVGLVCIWCNSIWIAVAFMGIYIFSEQIAVILAFPMALSSAALLLGEFVKILTRYNN